MLKAALACGMHATTTRSTFLCARATDVSRVFTIYTGEILAGRISLTIGWARSVFEIHRQIRERRVRGARNDQRRWRRSQVSAEGERRNCDDRNDRGGPDKTGKSIPAQPARTIVAPRRSGAALDSRTPASTREPLTTFRAKVGTVHRGRLRSKVERASRPWIHAQDARATFKLQSPLKRANYIRLASRATRT